MAKVSPTKPPCFKTETMDESLEYIFFSMMQHGEISDAVDFITSVDYQFTPTKKVIQALIFKVLMECDDVRSLSRASVYLTNVMDMYPPINDDRRQFFYESVRESHGFFSDLWSVFCHIVNSYFCHHEIYVITKENSGSAATKYPNCKFLLDFYVKLFANDFEYVFADSFKGCLVMNLFWPSGDINTSNRTEQLFKWIDDIYSSSSVNKWPDLLHSLHEMLTLVVKSIIQGRRHLVEVAAFNHPSLADIADDIINFCKNAFINLSNVKLFLSFINLQCLQARVSEKIIRTIFKQSPRSFTILTLKEIVNQYVFPQKFNKWKNSKSSVCKEKNLRKRSDKPTDTNRKAEKTKLHELCKQNKFADLMLALRASSDLINTRDLTGSTPLHEACLSGSYMCVKMLVNECGQASVPKLDFTASNSEGITPLHIAVKNNSLEIARLLLISGGSELLNAIDVKGQHPSDLSSSEEMRKLLEEYSTKLTSDNNEIDAFVEDSQTKEAPALKSFKEYSVYLHALNCLLCTYTDLSQLYNVVWKKTDVIESHSEKRCCHFENDEIACSEDVALLPEMPDLIDAFIASVKKNVSKLNINIDIELIPLKAYKASIQPKP